MNSSGMRRLPPPVRLLLGAFGVAFVLWLAVVYGRYVWKLGVQAGVTVPVGPDAVRWGLAALVVKLGDHSMFPPLMPTLTAWTSRLQDSSLVDAALKVNAACLSLAIVLAAAASALLCRTAAMGAASALATALLVVALIPVAPSSWYVQPELVTLAALAGVAFAGSLLARMQPLQSLQSLQPRQSLQPLQPYSRGELLATVLLGVVLGLNVAAREHGIAIAGLGLLLVPALTSGGWRPRAKAFATLLISLQLTTGLITGRPELPFPFQPGILDKALVPLRHALALAQNDRTHLQALPFDYRPEIGGYHLIGFMTARALEAAGPMLPVLGGALLGLGLLVWQDRRRAALLMGLSLAPLSLAVVVYTQPRHFLVAGAAGLAIGVGGVAVRLEQRWPRVGPLLLMLLTFGVLVDRYPLQVQNLYQQARFMQSQQAAEAPMRDMARFLSTHAEPGSRLWGPEALTVMTELYGLRIPGGSDRLDAPPPWPDMLWRVWIVTEQGAGNAWEPVFQAGVYTVYHLKRPAGVEVRCLFGEYTRPMPIHVLDNTPPETVLPASGCSNP